MICRYLTGTDLKVSSICLGTASIGSAINKIDSFKLLDRFSDLGGKFLDTALIYADWMSDEKSVSEKTIGEWIKSRKNRNQIVVGTKGGCPDLKTLNIPRLSNDELGRDLDASLKNLQTDYIDIYWLHRDDPARPVEDIIDFLNILKRSGKIRYFGCSNWTLKRVKEAQEYAHTSNQSGFCANQPFWSLAKVNWENLNDKTMIIMSEEFRSYHLESYLPVVPYSSQAGGFFSGRYNRSNISLNKGLESLYGNDINFARMDRVNEVAERMGRTGTEIALGWLMSMSFDVFPIIGAHTIEQLVSSCRAGDFKLDEAVANYVESGMV